MSVEGLKRPKTYPPDSNRKNQANDSNPTYQFHDAAS
jgi:hypothetical protein